MLVKLGKKDTKCKKLLACFCYRFAYVEFLEVEAVQNAILLSESELHNRPLKVFMLPLPRVTCLLSSIRITLMITHFISIGVSHGYNGSGTGYEGNTNIESIVEDCEALNTCLFHFLS